MVRLWPALILGFGIFAAVIASQGAGQIVEAVALAGWGVAIVVVAHLPVFAADAMSCHVLLKPGQRPGLVRLTWIWWIGHAVNALLPVAQVGGELVRARLLARDVAGPRAGGTLVVALTIGLVTLLLFAGTGAVLLLALRGATSTVFAGPVAAGLLALAAIVFAFFVAQQNRVFSRAVKLLQRLGAGRRLLNLAGGAAALDDNVRDIYRNRPALLSSCGWRLAGWGADVLEVWLALRILGHPVSLAEAVVLESLGQLVRAAGFAIPGALGVQEGGYLGVGLLLGIPGEVAIGLSLLKRVRDLVLGVPALLLLKVTEGAALSRSTSGDSWKPEP